MNANTFELSATDRNKLLYIINNIIENPTDDSKKNINFEKIIKIFQNTKCIDILYQAGFNKSYNEQNETRLLFDDKYNDRLESIHSRLLTMPIFNDNQYIFGKQQNSTVSKKTYLLRSQRLYFNESMQNTACNVEDCQSLKTIANALLFYESYIEGIRETFDEKTDNNTSDINIMDTVYNNIEQYYNNTKLLNDYNHLLQHHSHQFEHIYNKLRHKIYDDGACNLAQCFLMKRNQRNRATISKNGDIINALYANTDDIISQQLLDRIHCHYLHAFDVGYKLTNQAREQIFANDEKKNDVDIDIESEAIISSVNNILRAKMNNYQKITGLSRLNATQNRFQSSDELTEYSYGFSFYYWNFSAAKDLYIAKKWNSFRDEWLNHQICPINVVQWKQLVQTALAHVNTQMVRSIFCRRNSTAMQYDMVYGNKMSSDHLIALMLYCNFDKIQFELSQSFRFLNEESLQALKSRHANFYFLARLLSECVQCFGMAYPDTDNVKVFHAVNKYCMFTSFAAQIRGAFSASTSYLVALNFCKKERMILELNLECARWKFPKEYGFDTQRLTCFDMQWISDYPLEREIFWIGGEHPFMVNNIIDVRSDTDYGKYVNGLKRMLHAMSTAKVALDPITLKIILDKDNNADKQVAFQLLSNEFAKYYVKRNKFKKLAVEFKSCPDYVKKMVHMYCENIQFIAFFGGKTELHDYYFKYECGWINLDIISTIFPNVESIQCWFSNKDITFFFDDPGPFEYVMQFLDNCRKLNVNINDNNDSKIKLKQIKIQINAEFEQDIKNYINDNYCDGFKQYNWRIFVLNDFDRTATQTGQLLQASQYGHSQRDEEYQNQWEKCRQVGLTTTNYLKQTYIKKVSIVMEDLNKESVYDDNVDV